MSKALTLTYYANLEKENDGYVATFCDLPNVFTEGATIKEALFNAQEALDAVLLEMTKSELDIVLPSEPLKGEHPIPVSPEISAPILLSELRHQRRQSMAHVAKAMNIPYQQYQRLEHNCNMTLKSLKRAVSAMGGRVEIRFYLND